MVLLEITGIITPHLPASVITFTVLFHKFMIGIPFPRSFFFHHRVHAELHGGVGVWFQLAGIRGLIELKRVKKTLRPFPCPAKRSHEVIRWTIQYRANK